MNRIPRAIIITLVILVLGAILVIGGVMMAKKEKFVPKQVTDNNTRTAMPMTPDQTMY